MVVSSACWLMAGAGAPLGSLSCWKAPWLARNLTCAARGWHASTYSSGEGGLPWNTPDSTGKESVCQPFRAARAEVPRVQDAHPPLQARSKAHG